MRPPRWTWKLSRVASTTRRLPEPARMPFNRRINKPQFTFLTTLPYRESQPFNLLVLSQDLSRGKGYLCNNNNRPSDLTEPRSKGANDTIISPSGFQKPPSWQRQSFVTLEVFKVPPSGFFIICDSFSWWQRGFLPLNTNLLSGSMLGKPTGWGAHQRTDN